MGVVGGFHARGLVDELHAKLADQLLLLYDLRLRVYDLRIRVYGLGFRVWGLGTLRSGGQ